MRETFLEKLSGIYGVWDKNSARFGTYSYGDIASDLCISGSQFTKLLYGTATNGMYERSIKNLEQLKKYNKLTQNTHLLEKQLNDLQKKLSEKSKESSYNFKYLFFIGLLLTSLAFYIIKSFSKNDGSPPSTTTEKNGHVLAPFFDRNFKSDHISPFLNIRDAQEYCPGSAYEGIWALDKPYLIPLPANKPGLYYLARESDIRMKCYRSVEQKDKGKILLGFENMIHELWIDTKRESLAPRYFNTDSKTYTKAFYNIDFEKDPSFKKIATIKSFMFNTFTIKDKLITRKGEPIGRYAEQIDHNLANQYEIDIKDVLENIVGNMVRTNCMPAINNSCNPNTLEENESRMKFDCQFSINNENLGFGGSYPYSKSFVLKKQNYSDNLLCNCDD